MAQDVKDGTAPLDSKQEAVASPRESAVVDEASESSDQLSRDHGSGVNPGFAARAAILDQGVRALFVANGSAAVAVLALVGDIIGSDPILGRSIAANIPFFAGGVAAAAVVYFVRFFRAFTRGTAEVHRPWDGFTSLWFFFALVSLACFLAGVTMIGLAAGRAV